MSGIGRSITQNILIPLRLETNRSVKALSNQFIKTDSSREELLLGDKIKRIYLGFEKIGLPIHGFTDNVFFVTRLILPSEVPVISGKRWVHASVLVETENGYQICVEYGGYNGESIMLTKEKNNKKYYPTYYYNKKEYGVRFAEMDFYTYKYHKLDYDSYSERIFTLHPAINVTLGKALRLCHYNQKWVFENYDLASHNCQDFIAEFLDATCAIRNEGEEYRGLHNIASAKIPKRILKVIEKNEDDDWNTVGKVPLFGPIISGIHGLFAKIKGH